MSDDNQIVLQLDAEDRATIFAKEQRLQRSAYDKTVKLLGDGLKFISGLDSRQHQDNEYEPHALNRIHNTIFINGDRGTGKTAFMLNLKGAYHASLQEKTKGVHFCQPIDPTLLSLKEDLINVIIGQIHSETEYARYSDNVGDGYLNSLERVTDALASEFNAKNSFGIDKLLDFKGSLELEKRLFEFFEEARKVFECEVIVMLIDDVDMSLDMAFNVLEVIRKYLASPHVLPVVSGDKHLYMRIIHRHFIKRLAMIDERPTATELTQSAELAKQYIQKIFPRHAEVGLKTIRELNSDNPIMVESNKVRLSFDDIYHRIEMAIYAGCNGIEKSRPDFRPRTSRDLSQLLSTLHQFSQTLAGQNISLFDKDGQQSSNALFNQRDFLNHMANYFSACNKPFLQMLLQTSSQIFLPPQSQRKTILLRDIGLFNLNQHQDVGLGAQLADESIAVLNDNKRYSQSDIDGQSRFLKQLPTVMTSFPPVEPYAGLLKVAKDRAQELKGKDKLLLKLYTHKGFYSSYQTGNLIFFGKIFELIVSSIYQDLDTEVIKKLLDEAPYHSFFHYFATKQVKGVEDDYEIYEEITASSSQSAADTVDEQAQKNETTELPAKAIDSSDDESPSVSVDANNALADAIKLWRVDYDDITYSAPLIYSAFNKYISSILVLKEMNHIGEQSIGLLHQRVKFILLNSFATFEGEAAQVIKQNVAIAKEFDPKRVEQYDQSFLRNIKPLLGKKTLTNALYNHPVFKLDGLQHFNIWKTVRYESPSTSINESETSLAAENIAVTTKATTQKRVKRAVKKAPITKASITKSATTKAVSTSHGQSNDAAKARAALQAVVTRAEIESLRNASGDEKSLYLIRDVVGRIARSEQMAHFKTEYLRQKNLSRSHFYIIYYAAKTYGRDGMLDAWLAGKL